MSPLAIVIAIFLFVGIFLIVRSFAMPAATQGDLLEQRLAKFRSGQQFTTLTDVELSLPFFDRAIRPGLDRISNIFASAMPARSRERLQQQLDLAGRPWGLTPANFQLLRIVAIFFALAVSFMIAFVVNGGTQGYLLALVFGLALGALPPRWLVTSAAKKRQREILLGMPAALDLITISVEAGLGFDAAIARVTEKYKNALAREFNQYLNEIRLGRSRSEAMGELGRRTGVDELNNFCQAVIQSENLGVGIANVLRIQSEELRRRRRQRAEEAGQKAPLKMLFPMVGCIFPTLFVVLLGPAALQVAGGIGGH